MDFGRIITRSFEIALKHRALWVFGILLAIFGGSGGFNSSFNYNFGGGGGRTDTPFRDLPPFPSIPTNTILMIVGVIICIVLIWIVLSVILRLVSRGALIGLVSELETDKTEPKVRRGFSIGFDRFSSLLGIALLVNVPLTIVSLVLFLIAALPLIASLIPLINAGRPPEQVIGAAVVGIASSIALICCVALLLSAVGLVIQPFYQFFMRAAVISKLGARDAIREGYRLVRANLGNTVLLYVILIGFGILYAIVSLVFLFIAAAAIAGVGVGVGMASQSTTNGIIAGAVIAVPLVILFLLLSGLYQVFDSAFWTQGYLAMSSRPVPTTDQVPAPAT